MGRQIRAKLTKILPQIKDALVKTLKFPPERVHYWARTSPLTHFEAEAEVFIQVYEEGKVDQQEDATGRVSCWVNRRIGVWCCTRVALDEANTDEVLLLHPERGLLVLEQQVWEALMMLHPAQDDGDLLTIQPVYYLGSSTPDRELGLVLPIGWIGSVMFFQISFERKADQSKQ
jgi:hypothetical protein